MNKAPNYLSWAGSSVTSSLYVPQHLVAESVWLILNHKVDEKDQVVCFLKTLKEKYALDPEMQKKISEIMVLPETILIGWFEIKRKNEQAPENAEGWIHINKHGETLWNADAALKRESETGWFSILSSEEWDAVFDAIPWWENDLIENAINILELPLAGFWSKLWKFSYEEKAEFLMTSTKRGENSHLGKSLLKFSWRKVWEVSHTDDCAMALRLGRKLSKR
ncbi:MAG: hypothetical protein ACD_2C00052G0005 [uncultured bacterium (gcode 4)]|uniref:Uncharacterized protein n=1 Tax=uncultured bacterium (gcode 4) TaxID=1234023 RepID=K2GHW2_9BACT|nr:MAG: hypothetical protein ACD_2C00052G0005 [uncultured bacterium (gcode 4)]